MIQIMRAACPSTLDAAGSKAKDRYSHQEVVDTLHAMQHGKCCYCEFDISDEGHGKAVEHFAPKGTYEGKQMTGTICCFVARSATEKKAICFQ